MCGQWCGVCVWAVVCVCGQWCGVCVCGQCVCGQWCGVSWLLALTLHPPENFNLAINSQIRQIAKFSRYTVDSKHLYLRFNTLLSACSSLSSDVGFHDGSKSNSLPNTDL